MWSTDRDGEVDRLAEYELQHGAGNHGGHQVRRQIVMQEELTAHEEEGEVVDCPHDEEETG